MEEGYETRHRTTTGCPAESRTHSYNVCSQCVWYNVTDSTLKAGVVNDLLQALDMLDTWSIN